MASGDSYAADRSADSLVGKIDDNNSLTRDNQIDQEGNTILKQMKQVNDEKVADLPSLSLTDFQGAAISALKAVTEPYTQAVDAVVNATQIGVTYVESVVAPQSVESSRAPTAVPPEVAIPETAPVRSSVPMETLRSVGGLVGTAGEIGVAAETVGTVGTLTETATAAAVRTGVTAILYEGDAAAIGTAAEVAGTSVLTSALPLAGLFWVGLENVKALTALDEANKNADNAKLFAELNNRVMDRRIEAASHTNNLASRAEAALMNGVLSIKAPFQIGDPTQTTEAPTAYPVIPDIVQSPADIPAKPIGDDRTRRVHSQSLQSPDFDVMPKPPQDRPPVIIGDPKTPPLPVDLENRRLGDHPSTEPLDQNTERQIPKSAEKETFEEWNQRTEKLLENLREYQRQADKDMKEGLEVLKEFGWSEEDIQREMNKPDDKPWKINMSLSPEHEYLTNPMNHEDLNHPDFAELMKKQSEIALEQILKNPMLPEILRESVREGNITPEELGVLREHGVKVDEMLSSQAKDQLSISASSEPKDEEVRRKLEEDRPLKELWDAWDPNRDESVHGNNWDAVKKEHFDQLEGKKRREEEADKYLDDLL